MEKTKAGGGRASPAEQKELRRKVAKVAAAAVENERKATSPSNVYDLSR